MEIVDYVTGMANWSDLKFLQPILNVHGKKYQLATLENAKDLLLSEMGVTEAPVFSSSEFLEASDLVKQGYYLIEKHFPIIHGMAPKYCLISRGKESTLTEPWNTLSAFACEESVYCSLFPNGNWRYVLELNAIHELHHVVRYKFSSPHQSFLDWLMLEGLAGLFEIELKPTPFFMPWWTSIPESTLKEYLPKVMEFWDSPDFMKDPVLSNAWFFGSPKLGIPRAFGYNLGIWLVKNSRREKYSALSWMDLIKLPSKDLVQI